MISRTPVGEAQRSLLWVKIAVVVVGVSTWGYGVKVDDPRVRWLGIAFLAVAFLVRFLRRSPPPDA
ncbi:MAG: hypothetical protein M3373_05555 [Gemmatimonadota bacterium]|nr:hypothetical protein [Gemmatimonadota bacterium]